MVIVETATHKQPRGLLLAAGTQGRHYQTRLDVTPSSAVVADNQGMYCLFLKSAESAACLAQLGSRDNAWLYHL
jgi:hypothetical protein